MELKVIDYLYERRIRNGSDPYKIKLVDVRHPPVYLKSEADKVIADKDAKILALDAEVFKQKHHAELFFDERNYAEAQLRHQKHKRCLTMAGWCGDACDKWMMRKAKAISLGKDGVEEYHRARRKLFHYMKWQTRWLELAKKFKEAK